MTSEGEGRAGRQKRKSRRYRRSTSRSKAGLTSNEESKPVQTPEEASEVGPESRRAPVTNGNHQSQDSKDQRPPKGQRNRQGRPPRGGARPTTHPPVDMNIISWNY